MCRSLPGRWSVPLLLLLSTGCASSTLQLLQEPPPYLNDLRSEYVSVNPDSPYLQDVTRGAVVPGMDRFGVLASWGRPVHRLRNGSELEEWTYYELDPDSGDALEYNLVFENGLLDRWSTRARKNTGLAYRAEEETTPPPVTTAEPPGGKKVPKN